MAEEDTAHSLGFIMPNIQIYTYFIQVIYKYEGFFKSVFICKNIVIIPTSKIYIVKPILKTDTVKKENNF